MRTLILAAALCSCATTVTMVGPRGDIYRCEPNAISTAVGGVAAGYQSIDDCVSQMGAFGYVRLENYNPRMSRSQPKPAVSAADVSAARGPNCTDAEVVERLQGGMSASAVKAACN